MPNGKNSYITKNTVDQLEWCHPKQKQKKPGHWGEKPERIALQVERSPQKPDPPIAVAQLARYEWGANSARGLFRENQGSSPG
jgi:hypothetical protein